MPASPTTRVVQILRDPSHADYTTGDTHGLWLAISPASGAPYVVRYAPDSGRWIKVTLAGSFPLAGTQCMQIDPATDRLFVLQYDSGTDTGYLTVIDTRPSGDRRHGLTAVNGVLNTFTLAPGPFHLGTLLGLIWDPTSGSLWTYSDNRQDDVNPIFFNLNPATGNRTPFTISGTVGGGNSAQDIFANGGFLYWAQNISFGRFYQFPISGSGASAAINGAAGNGPINFYDGGLNNGTIGGFDVDPTTGNIVALCNSSETTFFGNTAGYVVIHPASFTVVGQASSSAQGTALTTDASGNVWFVESNHFEVYVGNSLSFTKPDFPTGFSQGSQYAYRWFGHTNRQPSLFAGDARVGGNAGLFTGDDASSTTPLYFMGQATDAPITTNVVPNALVSGTNTAYPTNDQPGLWVSSVTKVARYSPGRTDPRAFFIVPLPSNVVIPDNGVAEDQNTFTRFYVLDQANSFVWVIDTTGILDISGNLAGVTGIVGYIDLTGTWPANTATFGGLVFDSTSTFKLFTVDGTTNLYSINPTTGLVTSSPGAYGVAYQSLYLAPINGVQPRVLVTGTIGGGFESDFFNPSSFAGTQNVFTPASHAVGQSQDGTSYVHMANADGFVYATKPSQSTRFTPGSGPLDNTFTGHSTSLKGTSGGSPETDNNPTNGSTVWVAFADSTASTNNIVNYILGGDNNFQKWAKELPSPFAFSATGNYGQGSYGFAWLPTPTSLVFASDNTNNELWSGDLSNNPMAVETDFPYFAPAQAVSAQLVADSSVIVSFAPTASLQADSSISAHLSGGLIVVSESFVGDSSISAHLLGGTIELSMNFVGDSTFPDSSSPATLDNWAAFFQTISVAFDGTHIWVADFGTALVGKIDPSLPRPAVIAHVDLSSFGITTVREVKYHNGIVYASGLTSGNTVLIDVGTNTPVGVIGPGSRMRSVTFDGAGNVWAMTNNVVGASPFNSVSTLNGYAIAAVLAAFPANGTPFATFTYTGYHFEQIDFGGGFIWSGGGLSDFFDSGTGPDGRSGGILHRVDPNTGTMVEHGTNTAPSRIFNAFYAFGHVWSGGFFNDYWRWDPATFEPITADPLRATGAAALTRGEMAIDDATIWAAAFSPPYVFRVSQANTIIAQIPGNTAIDGVFDGVAFDGTHIWVTSRSGGPPNIGLIRIDTTPGNEAINFRITNAMPQAQDIAASLQADSSIVASLMLVPTAGPNAMMSATSSVNANLRFVQRLLSATLPGDSDVTSTASIVLGPSAHLLADSSAPGSMTARYAAAANVQATAIVNEFLFLPKPITGVPTGGNSNIVASLGLAFKAALPGPVFTPVGARSSGSEALQQQPPPPHRFEIKKKP